MMNPIAIIEKYYPVTSKAYTILINHGLLVAEKCLDIVKQKPSLTIELEFLEQAAILHDIGIYMTNASSIGCYGSYPYICHGYLGADLLREEGLPTHALVAERHTGTGISIKEIKEKELPLPHKEMQPISIEEQLICFSDKFFSKTKPNYEKSIEEVRMSLRKINNESVEKFDEWCQFFL